MSNSRDVSENMPEPTPTEIKLHKVSRVLEVTFDDGSHFELPCEYLRVYSPSASVRGHGPGQETLQVGKELVNIEKIEPVGSYAIKPYFTDGHDTGLFTWSELYRLGVNQASFWQDYLERLQDVGHERIMTSE